VNNLFIFGFAAGVLFTLAIIKVMHLLADIRMRRNKGFTYSKALKRSLKSFKPFNSI
jgi:hypothetical protein